MLGLRSVIATTLLPLGFIAATASAADQPPANSPGTQALKTAMGNGAQTPPRGPLTQDCKTAKPSNLPVVSPPGGAPTEAPASFNQKSPDEDQDKCVFDKVENTKDELGPVYNAQSCRECHQNLAVNGRLKKNDEPAFDINADFVFSGTSSQIMEHRAGHLDRNGKFVNPTVPLNTHRPAPPIMGRNLINDRTICVKVQEHTPDIDRAIQTNRVALNILGDGFVEAIPQEAILDVRDRQCNDDPKFPVAAKGICGQAIRVPVLEASNGSDVKDIETKLGRFGWKNQQASLLSFAADAYLNEMGITNDLQPTEVTSVCDIHMGSKTSSLKGPGTGAACSATDDKKCNDDSDDHDIIKFARFMRSTDVIPRSTDIVDLGPSAEQKIFPSEGVQQINDGEGIFKSVGCEACHTQTFNTAGSRDKLLALFPGATTCGLGPPHRVGPVNATIESGALDPAVDNARNPITRQLREHVSVARVVRRVVKRHGPPSSLDSLDLHLATPEA